jgi:hypothetical protein
VLTYLCSGNIKVRGHMRNLVLMESDKEIYLAESACQALVCFIKCLKFFECDN